MNHRAFPQYNRRPQLGGGVMKRLAWAFALAALPTIIAAQAPGPDRLSLDLYLEFETVKASSLFERIQLRTQLIDKLLLE